MNREINGVRDIEVSDGDGSSGGDGAVGFADANGVITGGDGGLVVITSDGDGDVLGWIASIAVIDGDGEDSSTGFTVSEEVEVGFINGVGPVDGAVVGIGIGIRSVDGEGRLDGLLLSVG